MPGFVSPGGMAANALEQFLVNREATQHQNLVDEALLKRENRMAQAQEIEMQHAREALDEKRREFNDTLEEKKLNAHEKFIGTMLPGDMATPEQMDFDDKHHLGNFPMDPNTGLRTYRGTAAQREKLQDKKRVDDIIAKVPTLEPGSPDYIRAATQYEMLTGKTLPAGLVKTPAAPKQPVRLLLNPRVIGSNPYTNAATMQPATPEEINDPNAKTDRLEPEVPKDKSAGDNARLDRAHKSAIDELDKWSKETDGTISGIRSLSTSLNQRTPTADALIAPQILKATVSGPGTGFRMTKAEIDNVLGARSRWDSLRAALQKWDTDHSKALSLTEPQRDDMRKLVRAIRDKAVKMSRTITDARHKIDDAENVKDIYKASTSLKEQIDAMGMDDEDIQPAVSHETATSMVTEAMKKLKRQ